MIAAFLQDEVVKVLKDLFKGYMLPTELGKREMNIYSQNLPLQKALNDLDSEIDDDIYYEDDDREDSLAKLFPFVMVKINGCSVQGPNEDQLLKLQFVIGVYDDALDNQGSKDALNVINKIYIHFSKHPLINNQYRMQYPITWELQDAEREETSPYYFGFMDLQFSAKGLREEIDFI